ncbi:hypothetical protein AX16_009687 [Volvariella volvacea WC 439]|nr:hypothetical protein AX16_009687 [Volvariella volvacea WC 439]
MATYYPLIPYITRSEQILTLADGRSLAYDTAGDPNSHTLIIFFHDVFAVGSALNVNKAALSRGIRYIAPTIAGWGKSSPRPAKRSYAAELASDISSLISHLYPSSYAQQQQKIYVAGTAYGTIHAQMLFGLPRDVFPLGRQVRGMLLLSPLSPFKYHTDFAKGLSWPNWFMFGPASQFLPFHLVPRLASMAIKSSLTTPEKAEAFIAEGITAGMSEAEKKAFAEYRQAKGIPEGELEKEAAYHALRSVSESWAGFMEASDVVREDWGFEPRNVSTLGRKILIVASTDDELAPDSMTQWLMAQYRGASLRSIEGGHMASLHHYDEVWAALLDG